MNNKRKYFIIVGFCCPARFFSNPVGLFLNVIPTRFGKRPFRKTN